MTDTTAGRPSRASISSSAATSTTPDPSTGIASIPGAAFWTEACSTADASTRARPAPRSARLLASLPPDVKTTPEGRAATRAATASRESSTSFRARRPNLCTDDALPPSTSARATASAAAERTVVVAL